MRTVATITFRNMRENDDKNYYSEFTCSVLDSKELINSSSCLDVESKGISTGAPASRPSRSAKRTITEDGKGSTDLLDFFVGFSMLASSHYQFTNCP